jgi:hypothetical protein
VQEEGEASAGLGAIRSDLAPGAAHVSSPAGRSTREPPDRGRLRPCGETIVGAVQGGPEGRRRPVADAIEVPAPGSIRAIFKRWLRASLSNRRRVKLQILGIEVIQAMQRFSLDGQAGQRGFSPDGPESNNSVPLVARKRTLVRVYVDSGVRDFIEVPNPNYDPKMPGTSEKKRVLTGELPNVSGTLKLQRALGSDSVLRPINDDQIVTARPPDQIERNKLDHTLNFVLPHKELSGRMKLSIEVHLGGAGTRSIAGFFFRFVRRSILGFMFGFSTRASTPVEFQERRLPRKLVHLLVDHPAALAHPTMDDYLKCLRQMIAMYPAPDPDFYPLYYLPGFETVETDEHLNTDVGFGHLSDRLRGIKEQFDLSGLELTVLYPKTPVFPGDVVSNVVGHGEIAAIFDNGATFAHELGHRFGLGHAVDQDPRIPSMSTDELGLDMSMWPPVLVPRGVNEIMDPSSGQWPSTFTWQALFDQFIP